jgi:hypothetical protein
VSLNRDQNNKHRIFSYSPLATKGLSLLSTEVAELSEEQRATLAKQGFVICRDRSYPNFVEGSAALFKADLPVFVSVDVLLIGLDVEAALLCEVDDTFLQQLPYGLVVFLMS